MSSKCCFIFKSQKPVQFLFSKIHFLSYLLSLPVDVIAVVVVVAVVVAAALADVAVT
jgi:hypothetical protein